MNSDKALLRKYEDDLNICGLGVVIMGAWGVIRVLIVLFLGTKENLGLDEIDRNDLFIAMIVVIAIIAATSFIVIKIHLYVGLNAMRAARGKEHKSGYFVVAVILTVLSIIGLLSYRDSFNHLENIDTTIASILVDLTTIYLFLGVIISTVKIKKIKKNGSQDN